MNIFAVSRALINGELDLKESADLVCDSILKQSVTGRWHPYGFVVFHVAANTGGEQVRLHIWPDSFRLKQEPEWPIHSHPWDFTSVVLQGELYQTLYSVTPANSGDFIGYTAGYSMNTSFLSKTTQRYLALPKRQDLLTRGSSSTIFASEFHDVEVRSNTLAATLVLSDAPSKARPVILGRPGFSAEYRFPRKPISHSDAEQLLRMICYLS